MQLSRHSPAFHHWLRCDKSLLKLLHFSQSHLSSVDFFIVAMNDLHCLLHVKIIWQICVGTKPKQWKHNIKCKIKMALPDKKTVVSCGVWPRLSDRPVAKLSLSHYFYYGLTAPLNSTSLTQWPSFLTATASANPGDFQRERGNLSVCVAGGSISLVNTKYVTQCPC